MLICLDILAPGSPFADPNAPHPCLSMAGGAIADFLPHLASLAHRVHRPASLGPNALVEAGNPSLALAERRIPGPGRCRAGESPFLGFSANTQPDAFWLRVYGEKMQAVANLFETRLTIDRAGGGPKPLRPLFNGLREARDVRRAALGGLKRKLSGGPGAYEGLWDLLARTYRALGAGSEPPITPRQIIEVNHLVDDLKSPRGGIP